MNEGSSNKGLIWAVVAILVVAVGAFLFFANSDEEVDETDVTVTEEVVVEEEALPAQDIVDIVVSDPTFTTLAAAVQAADLVETLQGDGPFTVFAPTDDAFAAALESLGLTADELLASENLGGILTYHVVSGEFLAADVVTLDGQSVETVNGQTVEVNVREGSVFLTDASGNEVQVTATDVEASNGVIHVIDGVLLPSEE